MFVRRTPRTGRRRAPGALLLTALLGAIGAPAPAAAAADAGRERATYRTQALPGGAPLGTAARLGGTTGAATAKRQRIELRAAERFSLAALRWTDGDAVIEGRMRAQSVNGSWTAWSDISTESAEDDGADGAEDTAAATGGATDPIWTGPSRRLQVELTGARPAGLRAAFVDVRGRVPRVRATAAAARADDAYAGIRPRSDWDPDDECKPRAPAGIGSVQAVAVHHTAGQNTYSPADVPAVILAVCKFHRNSNGWNDIGYNVLVDRFGGAWEGRAGGLTNAVVGAHAQGFNAVAAGISMLGDFTATAPPPAQVATVARVAAWRLAVAGVPRLGTVELTSAGGPQSRYKAGESVVLPRVFGHRDTGLTTCPGNLGYGILDGVRATVAAANPVLPVGLPAGPAAQPLPVKLTINTSKRLIAGNHAVVTGTATQGPAPLKNATVALQVAAGEAPDLAWKTVSTARTTTAGKYRFARKFSRSWRVRVARTDGDGGASSAVAMTVVPVLKLTVPKRMKVGRKVTLRGTIAPGRGPVSLTVERRTGNGRYVAGKTLRVKQTGRRLSVAITPHSVALYRFRLVYAGSDLAAAAKSPLTFGRVISGASGGGGVGV